MGVSQSKDERQIPSSFGDEEEIIIDGKEDKEEEEVEEEEGYETSGESISLKLGKLKIRYAYVSQRGIDHSKFYFPYFVLYFEKNVQSNVDMSI